MASPQLNQCVRALFLALNSSAFSIPDQGLGGKA